jgi:hypothetical protein
MGEACDTFGRQEKCRWRPLGRCRHRWEVNIIMDLKDVGWQGVEQS